MREIKFRAYDTHTKIMLPIVDIIKFTKSEGIYITRDSAYGVGINIQYQPHIELMQYTGLKDKNGKEIYEGDIIQDEVCIYEVYFQDGSFRAEVIKVLVNNVGTQKGLNYTLEFVLEDKKGEVIGNIYDNPELSEKGEQS